MTLDRTTLAFGASLVLAAGIVLYTHANKTAGKPVAPFQVKTTQNKTLTQSDLPGKVTLVYLFGEGCGACNAATPVVQDIFDRYPEKRLQIIAGDIWDDTPSQAKFHKNTKSLGFPVVSGAAAFRRQTLSASVPQFLLIDRQGRIRHTIKGFPGQQPLEDKLNSLLKER